MLNIACRVKKFCTLPKGCESVKLLLTACLPKGKTYGNYDFANTAMAIFVSRVHDCSVLGWVHTCNVTAYRNTVS